MNMIPQRVIITGFMAAGKTTVAAALARQLDCRMIDLDELITKREGRSVPAIIDGDGETRFREVETVALREALENDEARVIALGGGTWTIERNRAMIAEHQGCVVWLDAPFELSWQRIKRGEGDRPFARDFEKARRLYEERRKAYELAQLHVLVGEGRGADDVAAEIVAALEGYRRQQKT